MKRGRSAVTSSKVSYAEPGVRCCSFAASAARPRAKPPDHRSAKLYPPDGEERIWWDRLKKALGTASSDFVTASLQQLQAAAQFPGSGISEVGINAALAFIEGFCAARWRHRLQWMADDMADIADGGAGDCNPENFRRKKQQITALQSRLSKLKPKTRSAPLTYALNEGLLLPSFPR